VRRETDPKHGPAPPRKGVARDLRQTEYEHATGNERTQPGREATRPPAGPGNQRSRVPGATDELIHRELIQKGSAGSPTEPLPAAGARKDDEEKAQLTRF